MNERIKELVGQAKFMAEETINKQISKNAELDAFAEKFAELIVRDIVNGMRVHAKALEGTGSDNVVFVLRTHASGIEQQFGVEK